MKWIWQQKNWPFFKYNAQPLLPFENEFFKNAGIIKGSISHLEKTGAEQLTIELLTQEAVSTSGIEGEILKRESVQSSIKKHFGLKTDNRKVQANEAGIAEMMVDVYVNYNKPLSHQTLFLWHKMLTNGRRDLEVIGNYRKHTEPMQIVSGSLSAPKLFYEAPPSKQVVGEMAKFIKWYNAQASAKNGLPVLVFAGIVHLYFEIIHPFEDGNGRIGRALVEKAISQKLNTPALNSFAKIIEGGKKEYYAALQSCNHDLTIDNWLHYFCKTVLQAQQYSINMAGFVITKTKFFNKYNSTVNQRQLKVLLRVFEEGVEGFKGGLSAANYKTITGASAATATRDLQELVNIKALKKTGELKHSRYFLNIENV
jgi:Fic family protein